MGRIDVQKIFIEALVGILLGMAVTPFVAKVTG
jgi:hypothetical protein